MRTFPDIAAVDATEPGPIVTVALHAAHRVRDEVAALLAVGELDRLREEDPYTELWGAAGDVSVVVRRSRFEVDLNRRRERAVYLDPDDAWGLDVWRERPATAVIERSLTLYDAFYAGMRGLLDSIAARYGRFVVLDVHSYNHRRAGPDAQADDPQASPELNIGTASVDRPHWGMLADRFISAMRTEVVGDRPLDVRENIRFRGGHFVRWVNASYPRVGCALALEWKKTFMDEWTGRAVPARVTDITVALVRGMSSLRAVLRCT